MVEKEVFDDARDWEEEKNVMEAKFIEARRKAISWEEEAVRLRREWDRERKEKMALKKSERGMYNRILELEERNAAEYKRSDGLEKVRVEQHCEIEHLKECLCQEKRERVRLEQEVVSLQGDAQRRMGELQCAHSRCRMFEVRVQELERCVGEWELKAKAEERKERMKKEIREQIEFEERVRDEVLAKKSRK